MSIPEKGDYVIATKYSDGDPQDSWAVALYDRFDSQLERHLVTDENGNQFRANGYRRVKKISRKRAIWILANMKDIEAQSAHSVWHFVRCKMNLTPTEAKTKK